MNEWKMCIPEGTRDILFDECRNKTEIEYKLRETYRLSGFMEIKSPTLEFYDVFSEEKSTFPQEKMYKFFDVKGRILVMRPDITTPIARISATKLKHMIRPLKLCYNSSVYRMNESLEGKDSEIRQSGIEIIGSSNIEADAEIVITGINALINCGLNNFKIEIGHAKLIKALIKDIGLTLEEEKNFINIIGNKNINDLNEFLNNIKCRVDLKTLNLLRNLPMLFGDISILNDISSFTENVEFSNIIDRITKIYNIISEAGFKEYITLDLGMVHNLNYYTGIIFRGYIEGYGGNILNGGRYDNLLKNFGKDEGATGLAINVDGIIKTKVKPECTDKNILICYDEENFKKAYDAALNFRKQGIVAEISLLKEKQLLENYALSKGMEIKYIK